MTSKFRFAAAPNRLESLLIAAALLLTLSIAGLGVHAIWAFTTDDAYITLRYARNLAMGEGIVWNIHDETPVEGYSNFLFVILGALAMRGGLDPVLTLKILGVAGLLATLIFLWFITRTFVGRIAAFAPGLMLLSYPGEVHWTASGLETLVYQAFVVGSVATCFWGLGYRPPDKNTAEWESSPLEAINRRGLNASAMLLLLASLTRPEAPIVGAFLAAILFMRVRWDTRIWLPILTIYVLPLSAFHIWRGIHFESILGHSVVCKAAYQGDPFVLLKDYWNLVCPFGLLALFRPWRTFDSRHLVLIGIPLAYAGLLYGMDPIIGHFSRHALAAYAILLVVACSNLTTLVKSFTIGFSPALWTIVLTFGIGYFAYNNIAKISPVFKKNAFHYAWRMLAREELGRWIAERTDDHDTVAIGDSGMVPYMVRAEVIDMYCLNCLAMSSSEIKFVPDKFAAWVLDQQPRYIAVHSYSKTELKPHVDYGIFPVLVGKPMFKESYVHRKTFGAGGFAYWVFEHKSFVETVE